MANETLAASNVPNRSGSNATANSNNSDGSFRRPSVWLQIQTLLNTINHILIGFTGVYIIALGSSLSFQTTALHATLTVVGFHVLAAEAMMSHYHINPFTNRLSYRSRSRVHGILQALGGTMALYGSVLKILATEEHFTTLHGKVGLAATFMCFASLVGGLVNFYQPKFAHKVYSPSEIKYRHNLFGLITFTLAMSAIFLGYRTKFFDRYVDASFVPAISLTTLIVYGLTMIAPLLSLLDKLKYRRARR